MANGTNTKSPCLYDTWIAFVQKPLVPVRALSERGSSEEKILLNGIGSHADALVLHAQKPSAVNPFDEVNENSPVLFGQLDGTGSVSCAFCAVRATKNRINGILHQFTHTDARRVTVKRFHEQRKEIWVSGKGGPFRHVRQTITKRRAVQIGVNSTRC